MGLATATTDNAGEYTLRVPAARLKAAAVESGYANLEIVSPAGIWFLPYQAGALPARPSAPVTVNLGRQSQPSCGINPDGRPYNFTSFMLERQTTPAWAVVGQGYILRQKQTAGDFVSFNYAEGSSHTQAPDLGWGYRGTASMPGTTALAPVHRPLPAARASRMRQGTPGSARSSAPDYSGAYAMALPTTLTFRMYTSTARARASS
jgi:hypothetical protein